MARQESVTEAARQFLCSRTTVYTLMARYERGGLMALANRPRGSHEPVPEEVVELVVELKASAHSAPITSASSPPARSR